MSKKTMLLPLSVVYSLIEDAEGASDGFLKFCHNDVTFLEVMRIQANKDLDTISYGDFTDEQYELADATASDCNSVATRLLETLNEKGLSLSSVTGMNGNLLYKKNKDGKSFVAQTEYSSWKYRVANKFADNAIEVAQYSEEYDCVMDELEQSVFDETVDYYTISEEFNTLPSVLPCVLCVFDKID